MPDDQQDSGEFRRRLPSVMKDIGEIGQGDLRVSVIGTVIDKQEEGLVLDDGTGKMLIRFDSPFETELNRMVRVLGKVIPLEDGVELHGEFLQDMDGLDMELLKRLKKV
jgi:hypothetical protein